ncbi:MAG: TlyA family RNA methyltransferase [Deltaproteobacteria bacterium]|jgi:23S rRNA (cytidine1920-2'-O)/16S rRNA (cytidine1409-2'-O)-methyltransferase|nr:TlyA family RNA methyltransferase [Deltaproteobacteria bacterium]
MVKTPKDPLRIKASKLNTGRPNTGKFSAAKIRADELAVAQNLCPSRNQAQALILAGRIKNEREERIEKAGQLLDKNTILILTPGRRYASRGGLKLEGALEDFGIDPSGLTCLDLGASTGGFTDCLLKKGAAKVTAVDVGRGLMDLSLTKDPRVKLIENQNARFLSELPPGALGEPFDLAVADLSFISLALILPQAAPLLNLGGKLVVMVKPQFEVGRGQVGKGGIVRDQVLIKEAVDRIAKLAPTLSPPMIETARAPSKLKGQDGNQEVFLLLTRSDAEPNL